MNGELTIIQTRIRRDEQGRYCINDLHRASGGEERHTPNRWIRLNQAQALREELDQTPEMASALNVQNGGASPGTYVAKELVYAYAMWISPAFHLKVIRAFDALVTNRQPPRDPMVALNDPATLRGLLSDYAGRVMQLEEQVEAAAPTLKAFDEIADAGGSLCLRGAAKALGVKEAEFLQWMSGNRWIYRRSGQSGWYGYADRIASGHLIHKIYLQPSGEVEPHVREQVRVTAKGLTHLARHFQTSAGRTEQAAQRELTRCARMLGDGMRA